jgi:hypothetical protein
MVRKHSKLYLFTSILALVGLSTSACTVAVPDVSSLATLATFAAKSVSPFNQDNPGNMLFLNGQCLPTVTSFEYRLNEQTIWSPIGTIEPSATPANGEYKVGNPSYDLDCSDGTFDFYMYTSTAMSNFALNGNVAAAGDPEIIEIRGLDSSNNPISPTIIFVRPPPSTFRIEADYNSGPYNMVEVGRTIVLRIKLVDATGKHAMVGSSETLPMTAVLTDLNSAVSPAGTLYNSTCSAVATAADLTFNSGQDELLICYNATGTTASHLIQLDLSYPGMIGNFIQFPIQQVDSAMGYIRAAAPNSELPQTLLRGATYNLSMGLSTLYSNLNLRSVSGFAGDLTVNSGNSFITFDNPNSDPECGAMTAALYSCSPTSNANKTFSMAISNSYPFNYLDLTMSATPTPGCSTCFIFESPSIYPINSYVSISMRFGIVDGPAVFNSPYLMPRDPLLRANSCESLDIGEANANGTIIPALAKTLTVSTTDTSMDFYYDFSCSVPMGSSSSVTFAVGDLIKRVYYIVPSVPTDGISNVTVSDGTSNWNYDFYVK